MARKITGIRVDLGDDSPTVDVDTAIMELLYELDSRPRMRAALATLINFAAQKTAENEGRDTDAEPPA